MENNASNNETVECSRQRRVIAQLEARIAYNRQPQATPPEEPVAESGLETFQGAFASRALTALWALTVEDQVAMRKENPEADAEAAGTLVLHFPVSEPCPSTRCGLEQAAGYSEEEIAYATMIVITNTVRNWTYFYDRRSNCGTWVRIRKDAFVPGFA